MTQEREVGHNVKEVAYKGVAFKLYVADYEDKKWASAEARVIEDKNSNWTLLGTEVIE